MRRFLPRVVSVLCAIQALVIILCYMMTKSFHKAYTTLEREQFYIVPPWPAKLVLYMGPWLLIVPLIWGLCAILTADVEGGVAEVSERQTRIGYVLLVIMTLICASAAAGQFQATFAPIPML